MRQGGGSWRFPFKKGMGDFAEWAYEGFCTMGRKTVWLFPVLVRDDKPEQSPVSVRGDGSLLFWWGRTGLVLFWRGVDVGVLVLV